jgi:TolB-like protein/DNA-binding winged helix-turn-helix (wHTH) protein/Tfp pilus assembly protein PilF
MEGTEDKGVIYEFDGFVLNPTDRTLSIGGTPIHLPAKEFDTLLYLVEHNGRALTKDELMSAIWRDAFVEEANLAKQISKLRKLLGAGGSLLIETIPKHGYRFNVTDLRVREPEIFEPVIVERRTLKRVKMDLPIRSYDERVAAMPKQGMRLAPDRGILIGICILSMLLLLGASYFYFARVRETNIDSIAVLPFVNDGADPDTEYLSDGISEGLINNLSKLPNLRIIARASVQRYKGRDIDPLTAARELGVRAVLTGRLLRRGDSLSIRAELVDTRDNTHIWGEQYDRSPSDILLVQQEMARQIAVRLRGPLSSEGQKRVTRNYTDNVEAYRLYLLGRYHWNKRTSEGFKKAVENFEKAIAIDPNYALAYAGVADSYILIGYFGALPMKEAMPKAKMAAERALEIDDWIAEAHASLANIAAWYEWDTAVSEREFLKAIEVNPNYPTGHHWYGLFLAATKRFDEAVQELKIAQSFDPTSLIINSDLGYTYYLARRYDEAIEQCTRTLEMDANFELAHYEAGLAYVEKGNYENAFAEFGRATSLDNKPQALAMIGYTFARAGKRRDAERALGQLEMLSKQRFVSPNAMAIIHAALGNNDKALDFLEKDYDLRSSNIFELRVDPRMDRLRADPRFQGLLLRIVPSK